MIRQHNKNRLCVWGEMFKRWRYIFFVFEGLLGIAHVLRLGFVFKRPATLIGGGISSEPCQLPILKFELIMFNTIYPAFLVIIIS